MLVRMVVIRLDADYPALQILILFIQAFRSLTIWLSSFVALASRPRRRRSELANEFSKFCPWSTPRPPLVKLHEAKSILDVQSEIVQIEIALSFQHGQMRLFRIGCPLPCEIKIVQITVDASTFETARFLVFPCSNTQNNTGTSFVLVVHYPNLLVDFGARIVCSETAVNILQSINYGRFEIARGCRCSTSDLPYRYVVRQIRVSVALSLFGVFAPVKILVGSKQVRIFRANLARLLKRDNNSVKSSGEAQGSWGIHSRSASVLIKSKIPTPRELSHFWHSPSYNVPYDTFECLVIVLAARPEQRRSDVEYTRVTKDLRSQGLVFRYAIINIHSQSSQHDTY